MCWFDVAGVFMSIGISVGTVHKEGEFLIVGDVFRFSSLSDCVGTDHKQDHKSL